MTRIMGVSPELSQKLYSQVQAAISKDTANLTANYKEMTHMMYAAPAMALAAPISMFIAAPVLATAGSFTVTGVGLSSASVTTLGSAAGVGGTVKLVTNVSSQVGQIIDGKKDSFSVTDAAISTAKGAVLAPAAIVVPPVGAAYTASTAADRTVRQVEDANNKNYASLAADVANVYAKNYIKSLIK